MCQIERIIVRLCAAVLSVAAGWGPAQVVRAEDPETARLKSEFIRLCDLACQELPKEGRRVAFYQDSYAIRALAVAYDMTGNKDYLAACKQWSDRMLDHQSRMTPGGAYWMNYGRKPGETQGDWYVADSSSIALGVLATAVRCTEPAQRARYLKSVESFAQLVIDNYVGPQGGITDGIWRQFDGQWWCSSGIFGSLALMLYKQTGQERYQRVALGDLEWLNRLDFSKAEHISFEKAAPTVVMYVFEAYSTAMGQLKPGSPLYPGALAQIQRALEWMAKNQAGRGAAGPWDYQSQWGSKLGGLPFHMYVYARHVPGGERIRTAADEELRYLSRVLFKDSHPAFTQLTMFAMMSYAEKLSPGSIYRPAAK